MKNIKKTAAFITAAALCMSIFSACSDRSSDDTFTEEASQTEASTFVTELSDDPHEAMLQRSLYSLGNTYRIKQKLEDMNEGKEVTVAFLGGSITEGYTVNADECWAKLTYDYLSEKYPQSSINYVNAGLSGTPSILGNLRLQRDVLDYNADIVFIEYAVNDGTDTLYQESYDSLIKTILEQDNEPAVILLFNRLEEGYTAQDYMKTIGEYYDVGMISTADALTPYIEDGSFIWADYYNDSSHPNPEGHKLFCEFIEYYFETVAESTADSSYESRSEGIYEAPYENAFMIESNYDNSDSRIQITDTGCFDKAASGTSRFTNGWAYDKDTDGESFKCTVTGNSLFLICKRNNSSSMGKIEVYINGTKEKTINTYDVNGWGDPYTYQIVKLQESQTMEVEIKIAEGSEDKTVELLGIACS